MSPLYHSGQALDVVPGWSIFDYADNLRVRVPTSCGRTGECHECIVEVKRGAEALSPLTPAEGFLRGSYRLACQARVIDESADVEFAVLRRQPRILTHSIRRQVDLAPMISRDGDSVVFDGQRIDSYRGRIYGLAVDIGTTTVAMNLVDLETGDIVHTASFENPQRFGGSDIMHRISYDGGEFQGELRQVMLSTINFEIGDMARTLGFHRRQIYEVVIVGNSTMRDMFFGIDVQPIGEKPYRSVVEDEYHAGIRRTTALSTTAREAGLRVFPDAHVYGGPLIGSHVGADVAADLLAVGIDEEDEDVMLVDVGTNTEVVVGNRNRLMAASCPAGPAFEGGQITHGMPGYDGAVESVRILDSTDPLSPEGEGWREGEQVASVEVETIGGAGVQGICGSGLVDLLAELRRCDLMNDLGAFRNGDSEFMFAPEQQMSLSRADISALAQAKSANYSGQFIVLRSYGLPIGSISKLYLAGGFANYVNVENALSVGFIANVPADRIHKVGNAALEGATIMLVSAPLRRRMEELASTVEHIELETTPDFFDIFVEGCMFKPMAL